MLVVFLILEEGQSLYLLCNITHVGQLWSRILNFVARQPSTVSRISMFLSALLWTLGPPAFSFELCERSIPKKLGDFCGYKGKDFKGHPFRKIRLTEVLGSGLNSRWLI
jgi:hypothetical protein